MITSEFTRHHLKIMQKGIELFNDQQYWECHEDLEGIWLEARTDNVRNVYWAVIQVAAALVHYDNDNQIGARGLIKKAQEKFLRIQDMGIENDLLNRFLNWAELKKLVFALGEDSVISDFTPLYQFRFKDYPFGEKKI